MPGRERKFHLPRPRRIPRRSAGGTSFGGIGTQRILGAPGIGMGTSSGRRPPQDPGNRTAVIVGRVIARSLRPISLEYTFV